MLERVGFTNFKPWASVEMACGAITDLLRLFLWQDSIIQFLLLLKQTKEATDRAIALELNGSYVELGSISDAVHRHDSQRGDRLERSLSTASANDDR